MGECHQSTIVIVLNLSHINQRHQRTMRQFNSVQDNKESFAIQDGWTIELVPFLQLNNCVDGWVFPFYRIVLLPVLPQYWLFVIIISVSVIYLVLTISWVTLCQLVGFLFLRILLYNKQGTLSWRQASRQEWTISSSQRYSWRERHRFVVNKTLS